MIQNSSIFSQEVEEKKKTKELRITPNYKDIKLVRKISSPYGEAKVLKDFHIEITSSGETTFLEFKRGEIVDIVKVFLTKYVHLGFAPSGSCIVSPIEEDYFEVIKMF